MSIEREPPDLGQLIKDFIAEKGIAKAEFGRRISTSRQNVSLILKKEHMDTRLLWRICEVLEVDIFYLMSLAFSGGVPQGIATHKPGVMEIRLELNEAHLVQLTTDLVRGIVSSSLPPK